MSPIIYGVGGEIEKLYTCNSCGNAQLKIEKFISLNFKKLQMEELEEIRNRFSDKGYQEGLKHENDFNMQPKKMGLIQRFFSKKKETPKARPITTVRDYLCHLNLLQKDTAEYFLA